MSASVTDWPTSPLTAADAAFAALTCEPAALTLNVDTVASDGNLPAGVVALPALRQWLLTHPGAHTVRDAVWRELVRRARLDGPAWVIAAVGMAMPALRRYAGQLCVGYTGDPVDIDAEILAGFLTALRDRVDLARDAPYASLCRAAWRAGRELRRQAHEYTTVDDVEHLAGPRTPTVPYGHPDLLVRRAVGLGILDTEDEQPYIDVRLGRRAIEPIAARLGITVDALRMRFGRIDSRLADALASGFLTGIASPGMCEHLAVQAGHRAATRAGRAAAGHLPVQPAPIQAAA
ncbi:hypothetical protein MRQ36_28060 [Micromonospora sp. R77]|uniref:hypothetical protein n=1 Tax=Micromonospora sp. R77 TaxID=2925836 RepID=UPI001F61A847|nr:hypothetical protein [Micromonospora sp. R77]MCI4066197.1 hypothetical protein [Micromonospora sp. R77]